MNLKARFRAFWTRFGVAFSGALFFIVPALAWIWGLNVGNAIVSATGVVLLAYTIETQGMRMEMVRQNRIAIQPLLITGIGRGGTAHDRTMLVRNIGKGAALSVQVHDIEITRDDAMRFTRRFRGVDCVEAGKHEEIDAYVAIEDAEGETRLADLVVHLDPHTAERAINVTLSYEDIDGQKYETEMQMGRGGIKLLNRRNLATETPNFRRWDTNTTGLFLNIIGTVVLTLSGLYGFHAGFGHGIRWKAGWFYFHIIGWILFFVGVCIQLRMRGWKHEGRQGHSS